MKSSGEQGAFAEFAIGYARAGWRVLPILSRGKAPLSRGGVKDATTNQGVIRRWWNSWPEANIALAIPAGYLVLDLDSEEAKDALCATKLSLPTTARARTGRGWHLWFRARLGVQNRTNLMPDIRGVDLKALGGYVVVPPSVHPSGSSYHWQLDLLESPIADAPEWIYEALSASRTSNIVRRERHESDIGEGFFKVTREGGRNAQLAKVSGYLFRHLPNMKVAAEMAWCWARTHLVPPLPDWEIRKTIGSIACRETRRRGKGEGTRAQAAEHSNHHQ